MGRGRQKAKQTKVARKLKYYTPDTDYRALERELSGNTGEPKDKSYEDYEGYESEEDDPWDPPNK